MAEYKINENFKYMKDVIEVLESENCEECCFDMCDKCCAPNVIGECKSNERQDRKSVVFKIIEKGDMI